MNNIMICFGGDRWVAE